MNKRQQRLDAISDILINHTVGSQEELLALLASRHIFVTQATLSRDLKSLRSTKVSTQRGGYRYVSSSHPSERTREGVSHDGTLRNSKSVYSLARAGNLIIIKTRNGHAGSIASDLDISGSPLIVGTVAGADTVFAAMSDNASLKEVYDLLSTLLPDHIIKDASSYFDVTSQDKS